MPHACHSLRVRATAGGCRAPYLVGGPCGGQALRELHHPALGRRVARDRCRTEGRQHRRHVDDGSARSEPGLDRQAHPHGVHLVHFQGLADGVDLEFRTAALDDAGAIDQPGQVAFNGGQCPVYRGLVGDVDTNRCDPCSGLERFNFSAGGVAESTCQPAAASMRDTPAPMPLVPPVTMTVRAVTVAKGVVIIAGGFEESGIAAQRSLSSHAEEGDATERLHYRSPVDARPSTDPPVGMHEWTSGLRTMYAAQRCVVRRPWAAAGGAVRAASVGP